MLRCHLDAPRLPSSCCLVPRDCNIYAGRAGTEQNRRRELAGRSASASIAHYPWLNTAAVLTVHSRYLVTREICSQLTVAVVAPTGGRQIILLRTAATARFLTLFPPRHGVVLPFIFRLGAPRLGLVTTTQRVFTLEAAQTYRGVDDCSYLTCIRRGGQGARDGQTYGSKIRARLLWSGVKCTWYKVSFRAQIVTRGLSTAVFNCYFLLSRGRSGAYWYCITAAVYT